MYRITEITDALLPVVGWRGEELLKCTESESGVYFQDVHPLLTTENVRSIAPPDPEDPAEWKDQAYTEGEKVLYNNVLYVADADTSEEPGISEDWVIYDPFSDWLEEKTKASITRSVRDFIGKKMINKTTRGLLENKALFDQAGRIEDLVTNNSMTVGFEVIPIRGRGVTATIHKIAVQGDGAGAVTLYLYHSSSNDVIQSKVVTLTKAGVQWVDVGWELPYIGDDTDAGGSWYVCYRQSGMPFNAVSKSKDWAATPCCGKDRDYYVSWSRYLEIHPFRVEQTDSYLWDIAENIYTYDTNYGLNMIVSVECDITDFIIEQKMRFQDLIATQVAYDFIREMAYNPSFRINRTQTNFSRQELLYEIDGDTQGRDTGLRRQLRAMVDSLDIELTGMDRVCLPCVNHGIRWRTA